MIRLAMIVAMVTTGAMAQSDSEYTFYDASGRMAGRSITDHHGSTTFYGPDGRMTGRSITQPGVGTGTVTTYYGPDGRMVGVSRSK